jgi:hypothetical protein
MKLKVETRRAQYLTVTAQSTHYDETKVSSENIPSPILEFRIANQLFNKEGGEIMDHLS